MLPKPFQVCNFLNFTNIDQFVEEKNAYRYGRRNVYMIRYWFNHFLFLLTVAGLVVDIALEDTMLLVNVVQ